MTHKVLLVSYLHPYPIVRNGTERMLFDYERHIFSEFDVYFLHRAPGITRLYHYGNLLSTHMLGDDLSCREFDFVLFFDYEGSFEIQKDAFLWNIKEQLPSFIFVQKHAPGMVVDKLFDGIIAFSTTDPGPTVFVPGGFYDADVFYKNRRTDELIVSVGRIHPDKNQLELVEGYKRRIYDKFGIPLLLVGGGRRPKSGTNYFTRVYEHVDNVSVRSTIDPAEPEGPQSWLPPTKIAELCNKARFYVMASPQETFCIALLEAMACGATCIVNGHYPAFEESEMQPHIFGSIRGKKWPLLDLVDEALQKEIRIDASEWAEKYSMAQIKPRLLEFIQQRRHARTLMRFAEA